MMELELARVINAERDRAGGALTARRTAERSARGGRINRPERGSRRA